MDLQLYFRVLWRFRLLTIVGLLVALLLALLSVVSIGSSSGSLGLQYRESEQWASRATVLVTEKKFPLGRSVFEEVIQPTTTDRPKTFAPQFAPLGPLHRTREYLRRAGDERPSAAADAARRPDSGHDRGSRSEGHEWL